MKLLTTLKLRRCRRIICKTLKTAPLFAGHRPTISLGPAHLNFQFDVDDVIPGLPVVSLLYCLEGTLDLSCTLYSNQAVSIACRISESIPQEPGAPKVSLGCKLKPPQAMDLQLSLEDVGMDTLASALHHIADQAYTFLS